MAFAALNPLAALWRQRGLTCLLMPPGFDAFAPTPPTRPLGRNGPIRPGQARSNTPAATGRGPRFSF